MNSKKRIAIIGAGVCGATVAFRLQEQFGNSVSIAIFADKLAPNTTGDISAGLWGPVFLCDTPQDKILKWSKDSHVFFHKLWKNGDAAEAGISLLPATRVSTNPEDFGNLYKHAVFGYTVLDDMAITRLSKEYKRDYKFGINCTTFTCEPSFFLPYLYKRIVAAGGYIEQKLIESFEELNNFDIVINCTGLGAKKLTNGDALLKPIRGQVMRVKASWIPEVILEESDDGNYIIPNMNTIILGGTHQENDYNTNVDFDDRRFIYEGCCRIVPSIKQAKIVNELVGLRPGRSKVRLEHDTFTAKNGKLLQIVHNYGHGGSGVTLSYGCAIEVVDIVAKIMINANVPTSKL